MIRQQAIDEAIRMIYSSWEMKTIAKSSIPYELISYDYRGICETYRKIIARQKVS